MASTKKSFMSLYKAATASPRHVFQTPESKSPASHDHNNNNKVDTKLTRFNVSRSWFTKKLPKSVRGSTSSSDECHVEDVIGDAGEGRKSVSYAETSLGSAVSFLEMKVLVSDMPSSMQVHAFRVARRTYDKFSAKRMAFTIKKEFDKVHGPAWHCIVGSSFGSFVTHATGCFLYFSMDKLYILLFKTQIHKAIHN